MFCLRSWLPLLFIPTNASPLFIISFVALTYCLHRPCIYCSALLLILFLSSCNWSDRCFFDLRGDWLSPRVGPDSFISGLGRSVGMSSGKNNSNNSSSSGNSSTVVVGNSGDFLHVGDDGSLAGYVLETANATTKTLVGAVVDGVQRRFGNGSTATFVAQEEQGQGQGQEWAGVGAGWLRSLVGRQEWTLPCIDVKIRL